ncbi:hypothetical protein CEXT_288611 [Caerostris extrusa]|uniref:Uncharacterized protein n=1 Tax=Caerostris extrusa TaxID=172846 RepID=A0AAV4QIX2_CAEEX|nr:hypothetical protein CEXT_288611 [Caerostris extrusa]
MQTITVRFNGTSRYDVSQTDGGSGGSLRCGSQRHLRAPNGDRESRSEGRESGSGESTSRSSGTTSQGHCPSLCASRAAAAILRVPYLDPHQSFIIHDHDPSYYSLLPRGIKLVL